MQSKVWVVAVILLSGCSGGGGEPAKKPLTERQRDSVIGASRLPGAQTVDRALRVTDSATARRALEDSIVR